MSAQPEAFPVLAKPPIVEVVCGVHFEPLELDGMVLGVYWDSRKDQYPEKSLEPSFSDDPGPSFFLGPPPLRAVLVGTDKVHVLQIQRDRFFMNWRAMGGSYPRFSNRGGAGLMTQAIDEFGQLAGFCQARFGRRPEPSRIELAKIDVLERGKHWQDVQDLESLVRITATFGSVQSQGNREIALRFVERDGAESLFVIVNSITEKLGGPLDAVRIETRAITPVVNGALEAAFSKANADVNRAFFKLISADGLRRFEPSGSAS